MQIEIVTAQELAKYLRIDLRTVYRLAKEGKIPCMKIGGQWRFNIDDIKRFIKNRSSTFHLHSK